MTDPIVILQWVVVAMAITGCITSGEQLAIRAEFRPGGIYAWHVLGVGDSATGTGAVALLQKLLFDGPGPLVAFSIRIIAGMTLIAVPVTSSVGTAALWVFTVATLVIGARQDYGQSGADQLVGILAVSLTATSLCAWTIGAVHLCLWFIALQSILAYTSAGIAKLISPVWRNTNAVGTIFNSGSYGTPWVARQLHRLPALGRALSWSVIVFECAFVLVLFVGSPWREAFLLIGFVFHLINAFVMGLNDFMTAFVGTYPALWWVSERLQPAPALIGF